MKMICESAEKCNIIKLCTHFQSHEKNAECMSICENENGIIGSKCILYKEESQQKLERKLKNLQTYLVKKTIIMMCKYCVYRIDQKCQCQQANCGFTLKDDWALKKKDYRLGINEILEIKIKWLENFIAKKIKPCKQCVYYTKETCMLKSHNCTFEFNCEVEE